MKVMKKQIIEAAKIIKEVVETIENGKPARVVMRMWFQENEKAIRKAAKKLKPTSDARYHLSRIYSKIAGGWFSEVPWKDLVEVYKAVSSKI